MTSPAAAAILNGMPCPADLRVHHHDGTTFVTAGQVIVAGYCDGDIAMRNVAVAVARQLGFSGQRVAEVAGQSASYVATLHQRARREGAAGLARPSGPKPKRSLADWAQAARWRQAGASEAQIATRLGVAQATVSRHLAGAGQQQLPFGGEPAGAPDAAGGGPEPQPEPGREEPAARRGAGARDGDGDGDGARGWPAGGRGADHRGPAGLTLCGRDAAARVRRAGRRRGDPCQGRRRGPGGRKFADVALLSATSTGSALRAATIEQFRHLTAAGGARMAWPASAMWSSVCASGWRCGMAGPLAGLAVLPGLRTLRPRLAAIADGTDPLELQALFARAMLAAGPVSSGVYYAGDHFVPYAGRSRSARDGTTSGAGRRRDGRTPTSARMTAGRCASSPASRPA